MWAERERSGKRRRADRKPTGAELSGERDSKHQVERKRSGSRSGRSSERERSGERDSRKWNWATSGKFCRSAHMLCRKIMALATEIKSRIVFAYEWNNTTTARACDIEPERAINSQYRYQRRAIRGVVDADTATALVLPHAMSLKSRHPVCWPYTPRVIPTPSGSPVGKRKWYVWLGGVVVRALDLRLEIAGSIPAAALSSATLDELFTHIVQRFWSYDIITLYKSV